MDLNLYFEPVELEKPGNAPRIRKSMFGRNIRINTPNTPVDEISNYNVAIFGVREDRNSQNRGSAMAPDSIRNSLYHLYRINDKLKIIDLGNLKSTQTIGDTYFGVSDVVLELLRNQVLVIMLGGTQDITYGAYMAFEKDNFPVNVVSVDSRLDLCGEDEEGDNWMRKLLSGKKLFRYTSLGHQQYLVDRQALDEIEKGSFEAFRLGQVREDISMTEPIFRDARLVSFNMSAVRQSDSPGTIFPSPNGFMAEEACQMTRYAGLSDHVSCLGIFDANPEFDRQGQTANLAAQMIWYFIEGYTQRKAEQPVAGNPDFKIFIVRHQDVEHEMKFYKSLVTGRWWLDIPNLASGDNIAVSCSQSDYDQACRHEIPDLWMKMFRKIN
jgi:formiminoglutamase